MLIQNKGKNILHNKILAADEAKLSKELDRIFFPHFMTIFISKSYILYSYFAGIYDRFNNFHMI